MEMRPRLHAYTRTWAYANKYIRMSDRIDTKPLRRKRQKVHQSFRGEAGIVGHVSRVTVFRVYLHEHAEEDRETGRRRKGQKGRLTRRQFIYASRRESIDSTRRAEGKRGMTMQMKEVRSLVSYGLH